MGRDRLACRLTDRERDGGQTGVEGAVIFGSELGELIDSRRERSPAAAWASSMKAGRHGSAPGVVVHLPPGPSV